MNIELERDVMDAIYLTRIIYCKMWFRFNEIANLSGVKKSTLQRILKRLENIGWLKAVIAPSYSGLGPEGKVGYLMSTEEANDPSLPYEFNGSVLFPREIKEKFVELLPELSRKKIKLINFGSNEYQEYIETFQDYLVQEFRNVKQREKAFKNLRFKGRTQLLRKCIKSELANEYKFYRLVEYPYVYRIRGGHMKSESKENFIPNWNTKKGTKHFWKNAAKDMKFLQDKWYEIIPRVNLLSYLYV